MGSEKKSSSGFRHAVAWTVVYVFLMWLILGGLFNFNMFSVAHWVKLLHLHLHGFAGLVFGILILAAVPLYVATTVLAVRNKEMPVKIPLPKCLTETAPAPKPAPAAPVVTSQEPLPELRSGVPAEMRETFMRAQKKFGARQMSVFNRPNGAVAPDETVEAKAELVAEPVTESVSNTKAEDVATYGGMPIPADFDMDVPSSDSNVPVFADINFGDEDEKDSESSNEPNQESKNSAVYDMLRAKGISVTRSEDLIIANGCAIAVHDDDDFWVADEIDWFAAGKQRPSPIVVLKKAQSEHNLKPVLYLRSNNIMDLDKKSEEWIADGIIIVKDEQNLMNVLAEV